MTESLSDRMVREQIEARGGKDPRVLAAMIKVPRSEFIPETHRTMAYDDHPLPIGDGQTISQPYIVALMTELLDLKGGETVLEVGAGSGYQAAILGEIVAQVYTVEIVPGLARMATETLTRLGYGNVLIKEGDGYRGWPEHGPYDAIMVTAAPDHIPPALIGQLKEGGRLVIPVGSEGGVQNLVAAIMRKGKLEERTVTQVRFVPLTGPGVEKK